MVTEHRPLGELEYKYVGGASPGPALQKVDCKYNIRGWLTDINDTANLLADGDLFAFHIGYNTIGSNVQGNVQPLYNGNIAETSWISARSLNTAINMTS